MNTLTDKQKELLLSNKEDLKAIMKSYLLHGHNSCIDTFDSFASQFEPEWKILSFSPQNGGNPCTFFAGDYDIWIKERLKEGRKIHSVQYKSETLTVGDWCDFLGARNKQITAFQVCGYIMKVYYGGSEFNSIELVKKIERKSRFVTNGDGEEIFDADKCYAIKNGDSIISLFICGARDFPLDGFTYFKSKEKAEEYITLNAPRLSVNDVMGVVGQYVFYSSFYKDKLVELVKSKQ